MRVSRDRCRTCPILLFAVLALCVIGVPSNAAQIAVGPADYRERSRDLQPGDTLWLSPGVYWDGLNIHGLNGTAAAPITIRGPSGPPRAVFHAKPGRNTISIVDSSHVVLVDFDVSGAAAAADAVKAEGHSRFAHHITLERLRITGYDASQQNVGISTKCPAWNWTIRNNLIQRVGTGIYLGNSDGSAPFVRGVVENNLVVGTRGYSMQIKHQRGWPELVDVASGSGETIIRYNTFVKDQRSSTGELARPNVLLGHWPLSGRGAGDRYLVYGNLFLDNPTEALFQAEGNLVVYNNVFINRDGDGLLVREHNSVPQAVDVFANTILAKGMGLLLRNVDRGHRQEIDGNAVFAARVEPATLVLGNLVRPFDEAASYLRRPSNVGGVPDLSPVGVLLDMHAQSPMRRNGLPDVNVDFDRKPRHSPVFGAYAANAPADAGRYSVKVQRVGPGERQPP